MEYTSNGITIDYLPEMLEGQVAVLSSGFLSSEQVIVTLDALRKSALYRSDQDSYILYPNKALPKFLEKNNIPSKDVTASPLLVKMLQRNDSRLINKDMHGNYHFNGNFHNANAVASMLKQLESDPELSDLVLHETPSILRLFEKVFVHKAFTGRSGTFFGYEGLGSIYWHMVSKLVLAVAEIYEKAQSQKESKTIIASLVQHFHALNAGIGVHKSPTIYGAFPTDPYSHTPYHRGAQQPGMTGQVKEDILSRNIEFGLQIEKGQLHFTPGLLSRKAFTTASKTVELVDLSGLLYTFDLPENSMVFTYAQVPVIYQLSTMSQLCVTFSDQSEQWFEGTSLPQDLSTKLFLRKGTIQKITVSIDSNQVQE